MLEAVDNEGRGLAFLFHSYSEEQKGTFQLLNQHNEKLQLALD